MIVTIADLMASERLSHAARTIAKSVGNSEASGISLPRLFDNTEGPWFCKSLQCKALGESCCGFDSRRLHLTYVTAICYIICPTRSPSMTIPFALHFRGSFRFVPIVPRYLDNTNDWSLCKALRMPGLELSTVRVPPRILHQFIMEQERTGV